MLKKDKDFIIELMLSDREKLKKLYATRPEGGRKWSYWFNLVFKGHTYFSDHINFDECVAHEEKIVDLEIKIYGKPRIRHITC